MSPEILSILMWVAVFAIFYFVLIMPQRKKQIESGADKTKIKLAKWAIRDVEKKITD